MGCLVALYRRRFKFAKLIYRRKEFFTELINSLCIKCIYNYSIMTITDWLGLILTSLSILAIIAVGVRWVLKHYVQDILKELKPNGGSSIKDQVNRLENQVAKIEKASEEADFKRREMSVKLDHLYDLFVDYLATNQKPSGNARTKKSEK
jgi:hypothetical protein